MSNSTIHLVTGAAGLVGCELVKQLLASGKKVRALYHKRYPDLQSHSNLELIQGDLLDVVGMDAWMKDVKQVYHCAGFINYAPGSRAQLYQINVVGTENLVNACLRNDVEKLVHVSSIAALGRSNQTITEETVWTAQKNNSIYGESKYWGELEVWRGGAEGLKIVIVNPGIILGPGDWNDGSTAIFRNVYEGFNWYSTGVNGFVDVRDVAWAMIKLMDADVDQQRFILVAANKSYQEIFDGIADAFGCKRPQRKVEPWIAELVWRLEWVKTKLTGKTPLVTRETARSSLSHSVYDNSKLLQTLSDFKYRSLADTLSYSCAELLKKNAQ